MIWRANLRAKRLASVADIAICHSGSPNRRLSSVPTHPASSVGSIVVMPRAAWRAMASTVGAGE